VSDLMAGLRRLHLPTVNRLYAEYEQMATREGWSYTQYLERLVMEEIAHRIETRVSRAIRAAHLPFIKTIEEFDFQFQKSVERRMLGAYLGPELVSEGRCLILYGPPGTGKTALSVAIAVKAIQNGYDARFVTATQMITALTEAERRGSASEVLPMYLDPDVLVVDEVGYLSYGPSAANVVFQVVNSRYLAGNKPMIFTTNKAPSDWAGVLHDADLSAAILDRVLHKGEIVKLTGQSYRRFSADKGVASALE
jgi:DNA replication protein DnaC